jgi:hypothetical protein
MVGRCLNFFSCDNDSYRNGKMLHHVDLEGVVLAAINKGCVPTPCWLVHDFEPKNAIQHVWL